MSCFGKKIIAAAVLLSAAFPTDGMAEFLWHGKILDENGEVPGQRTQVLEFRLYESADSAAPLWGRTYTSILDEDGELSVALDDSRGSKIDSVPGSGLEKILSEGRELWIGIKMRGESEFSPRQKLGRGMRAVCSVTADGAVPGKCFTVSGRLFAGEIRADSVSVSGDLWAAKNVDLQGSLYAGKIASSGVINGYGIAPVGAVIAVYVPAGEVPKLPDGWVLCDGQNGTPDLRDRFLVGASGSGDYVLGATGGASAVSLSEEHLPPHQHGYTFEMAEHVNGSPDKGNDSTSDSSRQYWRHNTSDRDSSTGAEGTTMAHENRPPFYGIYWAMRIK